MTFARLQPVAVVTCVLVGLLVGVAPATGLIAAAEARAPKPVITSIEPTYGSSVGYAHLIIHGRHLKGGTVTVAGRPTYARVINSKIITAFPAGHRHGTGYRVIVRTEAGTSDAKGYAFRYARQPGRDRVAALPAVPGGKVGSLYYSTTRCPATGTCISVGTDDNKRDPLVARITTRGKTSTRRIPVPAHYDQDDTAYVADLSCPTTTFCAAVGGYNAEGGLFSTWNGSTWKTRSAPNPVKNPDEDNLTHVSCGAPSYCVAIGETFVDTYDGGTLAAAASPAPAGYSDSRLDHVSCSVGSWCSVIGSGDVGKTIRNFVAVRHDSVWTKRALPDPPRWAYKFSPDLDGLDCASADRCTVLAGGLEGGGPAPLYFARLHAGTVRWTTVPVPADADSPTSLLGDAEDNFALHCPSTTTCWALSAYTAHGLSGHRGFQPVALRLHNGTARVFALPRPASSKTGRIDMYDLSCATPGSCVAVGSRNDGDVNNIHGDAIVETFAHGVWTPVAAPSPAGRPKYSGYEFTSVSCSGVGRCTAVGDYNYAHNPDAEGNQPLEKFRAVLLDIVPR